jgi:hypothetical protein
MNEVELIRAQLATERRHAALVANACVTALEDPASQLDGLALTAFCQTCVEYLVWVLTRFEERDQALLDLGYSRPGGEDRRRALQLILGRPGKSREALTRLQTALDRTVADPATPGTSLQGPWREFAQFFNVDWTARRGALDELFGHTATVSEWRTMARIDADSILDERNRFARVQAAAPPDIQLQASSHRS